MLHYDLQGDLSSPVASTGRGWANHSRHHVSPPRCSESLGISEELSGILLVFDILSFRVLAGNRWLRLQPALSSPFALQVNLLYFQLPETATTLFPVQVLSLPLYGPLLEICFHL